jgi:hypothetical protein
MAWTAPKTWTDGELVTAALMNEQVRDQMIHLKIAVDNDGKIPELSSTYLADLSGLNLTGIVKLANDNDFSDGVQDFSAGAGTRLVLPVGSDKWAT